MAHQQENGCAEGAVGCSALFIVVGLITICAGTADEGLIAWTVIAAVVFIIGLIAMNAKEKQAAEGIQAIHDRFDSAMAQIEDFVPEVQCHSADLQYRLAYDSQRRRIAILQDVGAAELYQTVLSGQDLIEVELFSNKISTSQTDSTSLLGRTVAGAVLGGGAGAVVGAVSADKIDRSTIESIHLRIVVDDPHRPIHTIEFFELGGLSPEQKQVQAQIAYSLELATEWYGIIRAIIHAANKTPGTESSRPLLEAKKPRRPDSALFAIDDFGSPFDELYALVKMHEDGYLTREEFEQVKAEILRKDGWP